MNLEGIHAAQALFLALQASKGLRSTFALGDVPALKEWSSKLEAPKPEIQVKCSRLRPSGLRNPLKLVEVEPKSMGIALRRAVSPCEVSVAINDLMQGMQAPGS